MPQFRDKIIFIAFTLLIYLPASTLGNLIRLAVLAAAFLFLPADNKNPDARSVFSVAVCMLFSPLLSGAIVYLIEPLFDFSLFAHEIMRMVFCSFLMITVSRLNVDFRTVYICAIIALVPNFIIQFLQFRGNALVYLFIQNNYVIGEKESVHLLLSMAEGSDFRGGSIFINPNVYMVIPLICLCVFLQMDQQRKSLFNNILIVVAVVSCVFTGSRTATVVAMFIMAVYYLKYASGQSIVMFLLVAMAVVVFYGVQFLTESRAMSLGADSMGSLGVKTHSYWWFWQATSEMPLYWLTGTIGSSVPVGMDSEWGHIYAWYGVFGIAWYIGYYRVLFRHCGRFSRFFRMTAAVCALVSFTASVMQCMPIFSFVAAVILSQLTVNREKKTETEVQPV